MKTTIFILALVLISCDKENNFVPDNIFIDERDGQQYEFAQFGDQVWMIENLRYLPANSSSYFFTKYGVLYSWTAAMNDCPRGWHIPSESEWVELITYLGEDPGTVLKDGLFNGEFAGWYQDEYSSEGRIGAWWSSSEFVDRYAWVYYVNDWENVLMTNLPKTCKLTS
jgi:uncharacterized protein (TIGR02145 family)